MDFLAQRTPEALPARSREAERPAPAEVRERRMAMARDVETPETVLARILEFRKAGRMKEAEELLQVFKKQYPAFELPAELREPSPTRPND